MEQLAPSKEHKQKQFEELNDFFKKNKDLKKVSPEELSAKLFDLRFALQGSLTKFIEQHPEKEKMIKKLEKGESGFLADYLLFINEGAEGDDMPFLLEGSGALAFKEMIKNHGPEIAKLLRKDEDSAKYSEFDKKRKSGEHQQEQVSFRLDEAASLYKQIVDNKKHAVSSKHLEDQLEKINGEIVDRALELFQHSAGSGYATEEFKGFLNQVVEARVGKGKTGPAEVIQTFLKHLEKKLNLKGTQVEGFPGLSKYDLLDRALKSKPAEAKIMKALEEMNANYKSIEKAA